MKNTLKYLAIAAIACLMSQSPALAQSAVTHHVLVVPYTGSTLTEGKTWDYNAYNLVTGVDDKGKFASKPLEGRLTRLWYQNPKGRSALEVYRNYEEAFKAAGATEMWSCSEKACGPTYARSSWNRFNGIGNSINEPGARYLATHIPNKDGIEFYIGLTVSDRSTQVDLLEIKAMDTGMVSLNMEALAKGLDTDGYVIVDGIFFDFDKTDVKPESKPALDEVSKLLNSRPELSLYVVGHTDMKGSLSYNMNLSKGRAQAVTEELVKKYGIARNRLEGHGVGPLSPMASNNTEDGRAKNRRVVLVAR